MTFHDQLCDNETVITAHIVRQEHHLASSVMLSAFQKAVGNAQGGATRSGSQECAFPPGAENPDERAAGRSPSVGRSPLLYLDLANGLCGRHLESS